MILKRRRAIVRCASCEARLSYLGVAAIVISGRLRLLMDNGGLEKTSTKLACDSGNRKMRVLAWR
jgi:hypothetical protein